MANAPLQKTRFDLTDEEVQLVLTWIEFHSDDPPGEYYPREAYDRLRATFVLRALVERGSTNDSLDAALKPIMDEMDPENVHDLGGWASNMFCGEDGDWKDQSVDYRKGLLRGFVYFVQENVTNEEQR